MTQNYHVPIELGEVNSLATINTRLSSIDSGITDETTALHDEIDAIVIGSGTSPAELIAARTAIPYAAGTPPASLSVALAYAAGGIYNVLAYGAAGDGVADDTAEIQAAITAASAAGGGVVFFPEGTYKITVPLTLASYVTLRGVGAKSIIDWRGTIGGDAIYLASVTDAAIEHLTIQNLSGVYASQAIEIDTASARIKIRNVKIIGTTSTKVISSISASAGVITVVTTTAHGYVVGDNIYVYGTGTNYDFAYNGLTIVNTTTFSIVSAIDAGALTIGTAQKLMWQDAIDVDGDDCVVEGCYISTGIYAAMRAGITAMRCKFVNNHATDLFRGFMIDAGAKYNIFAHNTFHLCKHIAGKIETGAEHNRVVNNVITECSQNAYTDETVVIAGSYSVIENNNFYFVTPVSLGAIGATGNSSHVVIKGNVIQGHTGEGIRLHGPVTYSDVIGNHVKGGTTGIRFIDNGFAYITCCNNHIADMSLYGFFLKDVSGFVIQNNTIVNITTNSGIRMDQDCYYGSITGNMIINCGTTGIHILDSVNVCKYVTIVGNIILDVGNASTFGHITLSNAQEGITIVGNVMYDGTDADSVNGSGQLNCIAIGNNTSGGVDIAGTVWVANNF